MLSFFADSWSIFQVILESRWQKIENSPASWREWHVQMVGDHQADRHGTQPIQRRNPLWLRLRNSTG